MQSIKEVNFGDRNMPQALALLLPLWAPRTLAGQCEVQAASPGEASGHPGQGAVHPETEIGGQGAGHNI